jgi:hypothetical protein
MGLILLQSGSASDLHIVIIFFINVFGTDIISGEIMGN